MPLLPNNMPLSRNKDGLLSMQKYLYIFIEKNAEMFGGFADFFVSLQCSSREDYNRREGPPDVDGPLSF